MRKAPTGSARAGSSRFREALNTPLAYFFKGAPVSDGAAQGGLAEAGADESHFSDFVMTSEGLSLNRAFARISDPKVRKKIVDLVNVLAGGENRS